MSASDSRPEAGSSGRARHQAPAARKGRRGRHEASPRSIENARDAVITARRFFVANAALFILASVLATVLMSMAVRPEGAGSLALGLGLGVALGVFNLQTIVNVVGALRVRREPMLWSVLVAVLLTGIVWRLVLSLVLAGLVLYVLFLLATWAAGAWIVAINLWNNRETIRDHPDLMARKAVEGPSRQGERPRPAWKTAAVIAGIVAAVTVIGLVARAVLSPSRDEAESAEAEPPAPIEPTIARFSTAWNASRHDEVKQFLPPSEREELSKKLDRILRNNVWDTRLPPLGPPAISSRGAKLERVDFKIRDGAIRTRWTFHEGAWRLYRLEYVP